MHVIEPLIHQLVSGTPSIRRNVGEDITAWIVPKDSKQGCGRQGDFKVLGRLLG